MNDGLKDIHRNAIFSIFAASDRVERAVLFGSRAMGTNTVSSDVDIALFGNELTLTDQARIAEALEEIPMAQSVDLILYDSIRDVAFKHQITEHGVEWYQRDCHEIRSDRRLMTTQRNRFKTTVGECVLINCSTYSPKENWTYINYLDTGSITENQISKIQHLVIGRDKIPSRARRKVQPGDIVYSTVRPSHKHFGLLKQPPENCIVSTGFVVIKGKNGVAQTDYVYWFLNQDRIIRHLQTIAEHSTSAYPSIRPDDIRALRIYLPPLTEQRAIAHVLGTLDDKIELNRRMNKTLEDMAQALFKSWFVDFEPVRAKMEGRDTGLPKHISDLFPDRLVESKLGLIPEGWEVKPLDAIAQFQNGLALQKYRPEKGEAKLPVVKIAQLRTGKADSKEWAKAAIKPEYILNNGDVCFSWSRSLLVHIWCGGPAALNQHLFKVTSNMFPKWFFMHCVLIHLKSFQQIAQSKATTMGHIKRQHLNDALCAVPPDNVINAVTSIFDVLFKRRVIDEVYSRTLVALRDTLLPMLISGKIRLHDGVSKRIEPLRRPSDSERQYYKEN